MQIKDYSADLLTTTNKALLQLDYTEDGTTTIIASGDFVANYVLDTYYYYTLWQCESLTALLIKWSYYLDAYKPNLVRIYKAMLEEYNVLDNYNKTSDYITANIKGNSTVTEGNDTTTGEQRSISHSGTVTVENETDDTTTNSNTSYDNSTFYANAKSVLDSDTTNTTTLNNSDTQTIKYDKKVTSSYINTMNAHNVIDNTNLLGNDIVHYYERTHGNIGVTQNSAMILNEVSLRFNNYICQFIRTFFDNQLFLIYGSDED